VVELSLSFLPDFMRVQGGREVAGPSGIVENMYSLKGIARV